MPPKIQTRDSNISLTIITNSNSFTISLTLIVAWFRAFISETSTSLLLQSLMNQELSFWLCIYKTSAKIVLGFGYLFLFLSCVFVLWVFFYLFALLLFSHQWFKVFSYPCTIPCLFSSWPMHWFVMVYL